MKKLDIVKQTRVIHVVTSLLFGLAGILLLAWPEIQGLINRYLIENDDRILGVLHALTGRGDYQIPRCKEAVLYLPDKGDCISAYSATEAIKAVVLGVNRKGGSFFVMERT